MQAPKVSVIVPVYNTEKYLTECINSLTGQTLKEIEIIIVDDGSKEECAMLCDQLAEKDERISVIHKANAGLGFARNSGMAAATGEYVGFVDSDDFVDADMFRSLYIQAAENDADLAISGISFVGGNTFARDLEEKNYFDCTTIFEGDGMKTLLLGVVGALPHERDDSRYGVSVCKNIFRRSVLQGKNVKFYSEREFISEDTLFMVDYIKNCQKAVGVAGAFYRYRRNDVSLSKSYRADRLVKVLIFLGKLEAHLSHLPKAEYGIYLDRLIQGYGRIVCSQEVVHALDNKTGYLALRQRLAAVCESKMIKNALKKYPWYRLPKKQAAFAFAMKYKLYFLQKIMVTLRAR